MYNKLFLLVIPVCFLVMGFTSAEVYAYKFEDYSVMKKQNNHIIYVYDDSIKKLTERGFATDGVNLAKECSTEFIDLLDINSDCAISRNGDVLCVYVINSSKPCLLEFNISTDPQDCMDLFKMLSIYNLKTPARKSFGSIIEFNHFSFRYCDFIPNYAKNDDRSNADIWYLKLADSKLIHFYDGIPDTLSLIDKGQIPIDIAPPRYWGDGRFFSDEYEYRFNFDVWHGTIIIKNMYEYEFQEHAENCNGAIVTLLSDECYFLVKAD